MSNRTTKRGNSRRQATQSVAPAAAEGRAAQSSRGSIATRHPYSAEPDGTTLSFWSYVHDDDRAIFGKIGMLHEDICNFYRFLAGVRIRIFLDRNDIGWGRQWRSVIADGINTTTFMMPIVTPSYFQSDACRDELIRFNTLCERRGLDELILPIVFSGLHKISTDSSDPVARIIAASQYRDFTGVWLAERGSERWNTAVRDLVTDLVDAEERAENRLTEIAETFSVAAPDDEDDDEPGIADLMAQATPVIEDIQPSLMAASADFQSFADAVNSAPLAGDADSSDPRNFQKQIILSAQSFKEQALKFESSSATALERVREADSILTPLRAKLERISDPTLLTAYRASMSGLREVGDASEQMDQLLTQMRDLEQLSSALRRDLRPARRGATYIRDAANLVAAWAR